jgi:hypothetical protein
MGRPDKSLKRRLKMKQTKNSLFPYYKKVVLSDKEEWREYRFPGNEIVRIESPQFLIVSDNGHRVFGLDDISHYIPYGWIHLQWKNKSGNTFGSENPEKLDA